MAGARAIALASVLLASAALGNPGPTVGLAGVPDELLFPLPSGKNAIVTATLEGGKARLVWLAAGKDAPGRFHLTKVGEGKYQANLADPVVAALAKAAGPSGTLRVYAEYDDGAVVESIAIRYGLQGDAEPPLRLHVVRGGKRRALSLRRVDALAALLDREARGEEVGSWERWTIESREQDPGPDGWHRPAEIDAIEVRCGAERPVEAQVGDREVRLEPAKEPGTHVLALDDALREAWSRDGLLTLNCPVGRRDVPIALRAVPTALDPRGMATGVSVRQRSSADVPGSRGYLRIRIDDIGGPRVPLSLTAADGTTLLDDVILVQGDEARFDLGERHYKLVVERLVNELIGDDYIRVAVREVAPGEIDSLAATRTRIEALIRAIEASDAVFLRDGKEYTGKEAADHIRGKYEAARAVVDTVDEFIDRVAGASWTTGVEYKVRPKGGEETGAREWLREELRRIESE
ncbi:MAG: DUF5329 domain-containing protein [Planctomycetes bacterium]|nr:DUF5329 domain-containing protein [Planctomycetota bacterium]